MWSKKLAAFRHENILSQKSNKQIPHQTSDEGTKSIELDSIKFAVFTRAENTIEMTSIEQISEKYFLFRVENSSTHLRKNSLAYPSSYPCIWVWVATENTIHRINWLQTNVLRIKETPFGMRPSYIFHSFVSLRTSFDESVDGVRSEYRYVLGWLLFLRLLFRPLN